MAMTFLVVLLAMLLAWANGANDVSKGVATLAGSGVTRARHALWWGTLWTALGGAGALFWGSELIATFGRGFLAPGFEAGAVFPAAALCGAAAWVLIATRAGLPVSTTHALLGGTVGAVLTLAGPEGLRMAAVANKAMLPLLVSPIIALTLCWIVMKIARAVAARAPAFRAGCCARDAWAENPFVCAEGGRFRWQQHGFTMLHWLSSGATCFARGLNDVPKIAAFLIVAVALAPPGQGLSAAVAQWPIVAVTAAMAAGSLWGGRRVLEMLAHRVASVDAGSGLVANLGTSSLVLLATPLGLPVSTTHVSTGALLGIRFTGDRRPRAADGLKAILIGWIVTLPSAGMIAAACSWLLLWGPKNLVT